MFSGIGSRHPGCARKTTGTAIGEYFHRCQRVLDRLTGSELGAKKLHLQRSFFRFLAVQLAAVSRRLPERACTKRFQGGHDGVSPMTVMVADEAGNLYGITALGGASANCTSVAAWYANSFAVVRERIWDRTVATRQS
jgi:hypothetical protein